MADDDELLIGGAGDFRARWNGEGETSLRVTVLLTLVVSLGTFLTGFHLGVVSPIQVYVQEQFALDTNQWSTVVSFVTLGAASGALPCGALADRVGRKRTVLLATLPLLLGPLLFVFAKSYALFLLSRFVAGVGAGMSSVIVSMYITEVSPVHLRGAFGFACQLSITLGILFAFVLGFGLSGDPTFWRWMMAMAVVVAAVQMMAIGFFPESPRWLATRGRTEEARMAFARLWHVQPTGPLVTNVLDGIAAEQAEQQKEAQWRDLVSPQLRRCVLVAVALQLFQQFSGINAMMYYASSIFRDAGFKTASQNALATTLVATVNMLLTVVALPLVDRAGRKVLLFWSAIVMAAGLGAMGLFSLSGVHLPNWFAIVTILTYVAAFALGFGPVPWVLAFEILPTHIRGKATSVALLVNWMSNYVVAQTFPLMNADLGAAPTFWFYASWNVAAAFFVALLVRETKGKSLAEIAAIYGQLANAELEDRA